MNHKVITPLLTGLALAWAVNARAGSAFFDFNSDPTLNGDLKLYGNALWVASGGVGASTNAADGYLQITDSVGSQRSAIIFTNFDGNEVVQAFTFDADLKIGNGTAVPADGFTVNYVRANDPVLTDIAGGGDPTIDAVWATGPDCEANLPEEGTQTGISIGFDSWPSGGTPPYCDEVAGLNEPDIAAVSLRVDGILYYQFATPTYNGTCTDPTSLQTGPDDTSGTPDGLCWAHMKCVVDTSGNVSVYWKGTEIISNLPTTFYPSPGQLVFAGRTGGSWQYQLIDNINIVTTPASIAIVGPVTGYADGFSISITDSGASVVDITKPTTITLNGNAITPSSFTKSGNVTTITYHNFPTLLASGSTNVVTIDVKDTNDNDITGSRTFIEGSYTTIPASDAVTGVNTSTPGFRLLPWQSPNVAGQGEPNAVYWMQEQLMGLHGANNADLTLATDGGYQDFTGLINFNMWYIANSADIGDFQTANGYPDSFFPGLPGPNTLTGSIAVELLTYMQFTQPGIYTMGVNSDDGFVVTEGGNPRDRFAKVLGLENGGKGSSDILFTIVVTNAGFYPVRLCYENGAGEGTGNGANLEWFTEDANGTKILVNDPSGTNDSNVKVFYAGPTVPAFVAQINPYVGQNGAVPHKAFAQLADGTSSTVNAGSIQFTIDGAALGTLTTTKSGGVTTLERDFLSTPLASGSAHTATLVWADSAGTTHSNTWPFTVESYTVANGGQAVAATAVDTTKPGFDLHVTQLDPAIVNDAGDGIANQTDMANAMLAGTVFPWYGSNVVDTVTVPPVSGNLWYWTEQMDFNDNGSAGDFLYDYLTPGIPGVTGNQNNVAEGFDGWVVFPASGYYRMSVSSDDGFRLSPGIGLLRQVLHIQGANVNRDVAAVVSDQLYGNGGIGTNPPVVPITAPVMFVNSNNYTLGQALNLSGKIMAVDTGLYGQSDVMLCYIGQTNGALAVIDINNPAYGLPYVLGGTPPAPLTIPTINVNGFGGERDTWVTNTDLVATIGASQSQIWGSADYGKGMGRIDCPVIIPSAGAYPLHLTKYQGGGGMGLEWQAYQGYDGIALGATAMVLVNDPNTPASLLAYRALTVGPTPTISISAHVITYTGVLRSSSTVNGSYTPVSGASSPYTIPASTTGMLFYRASSN